MDTKDNKVKNVGERKQGEDDSISSFEINPDMLFDWTLYGILVFIFVQSERLAWWKKMLIGILIGEGNYKQLLFLYDYCHTQIGIPLGVWASFYIPENLKKKNHRKNSIDRNITQEPSPEFMEDMKNRRDEILKMVAKAKRKK